jgi:hypothetical protein
MTKLRDDWDNATASQVNGYERPPRVEDSITVHRNPKDGRPKIWLPDGSKAIFYGRPSSHGKKVEDTTNLSKWEVRMVVSAMLDYGDQSKAFRAERSALGPSEQDSDSKRKHNELYEKAKGIVSSADRVGTALHTITERWDLGLPVDPGDDFRADLEAWKRLTQYFEIATMPDGRPGVECFVAFDEPRFDKDGSPLMNKWGYHDHVRLAGTFDRLWKYRPCLMVINEKTGEKCGRRHYVGDLKSGKNESVQWNGASWGVQEAIYAHGKQYVPWADGLGATRYDIPDVCPHLAITLSLPAGSGQGQAIWTDIAKGYRAAVETVPAVKDHRNIKNWLSPFTPAPDLYQMIDACTTSDQVRQLYRQHPVPDWTDNDGALLKYASTICDAMDNGGVVL